ncbi:MAG: hypothetical protein ABIH41_07170 [Nanoarchaeota archaeon]
MNEAQRVGFLVSVWDGQYSTVEEQVKDAIGKAYLEHVVGLDGATIDAFVQGEFAAQESVGQVHAGLSAGRGDYSAFWQRVAQMVPAVYDDEDILWLAQRGESAAIHRMLFALDPPLKKSSRVIHAVHVNAHVYK